MCGSPDLEHAQGTIRPQRLTHVTWRGRGVLGRGDEVLGEGHDVGGEAPVRPGILVGLAADRVEDAPEVAVLLLLGSREAVQQVALGHQAEQPAGAVHHGEPGRAVLDHGLGHRGQRRIWAYGGYNRRHHVARLHCQSPGCGFDLGV
jgi:hypothetical protein